MPISGSIYTVTAWLFLYTFNHCIVNMLFTITFAGFYEVEKITGMDIREQQRYYHVKWQGYEDKDNTWEPETNVPKDLVADWLNLSIHTV